MRIVDPPPSPNSVMSLLARCLIECRDEYKYNVEAVELLIRNHLVNMPQYDLHLAQVCCTSQVSQGKCDPIPYFLGFSPLVLRLQCCVNVCLLCSPR